MPAKAKDTIRVYKLDIKEEIGPPVFRKTKKAFDEAKEINAELILIHLNTYGGLLDDADSIRTMILNSAIPVYVFIDNNAASAGALISIACDSIYMRPGASIGAATVVDQAGKPVPDKYQSYMRSMMRATAEAKGRDPQIAQAMVDPNIYIENIIDTGSVLTFTSSEAMQHGYCEGQADNIDEVLHIAGIENYVISEQVITDMDKIIGFLIKPYISGLLIMIIIGGIYFELQSPGLGFPSIAAVTAAALYFAPLYLEGLAANWEIVLFAAGLILVAIEIFAIPGFGIAGIVGILLVITGLTLSMVGTLTFKGEFIGLQRLINALFTVITALFLAIIFSIYFSRKLFTSTIFGQLSLSTTQKAGDGYTFSDSKYKNMVGKTGYAHTNLRPAGKIRIDDAIFDAIAITGFIDKNQRIKVVRYETGQLFVIKAGQ